MSELRLVGGSVLTMDESQPLLAPGEVGISGETIDYVGPPRGDGGGRVIDTGGKAVMPGLINAHTHAAMTLFRSFADDMPLQPWLEQKIWPLEAHLRPEDVFWGSQLGAIEMLRGGVTCFQDMYWHAPEACRAGLEAGMRVAPSGVLIGVIPNAEALLAEAIEFVDARLAAPHPRCHVRFGPHAPYTVPDAYLERVISAAAARGVPVHIHLSETEREVQDSLAAHGEPPVQHMERVGLFEVHTCAAHCVHLTADEVDILASRRVGVLASQTSNLKLGCGIVPLPDLLAAGARVGLATDGAASNNNLDLFEEIRLAALLHKGVRRDATLITAQEALELATWRAAEAVGIERLGRLRPGWLADVICLDLSGLHLQPGHHLVADLAYSAQSADVTEVIVGGELVVSGRQLTQVDQGEVVCRAKESAARLAALG